MLLEDFYTVVDLKTVDAQAFEALVMINADHAIFNGHFPNFPVTPGVAMLQIIKNCLESHLEQSLMLQSSSSIKFLSLVNPKEQNTLIFKTSYTLDNNLIQVKNVTTFKDGSAVLKCNVTFVR